MFVQEKKSKHYVAYYLFFTLVLHYLLFCTCGFYVLIKNDKNYYLLKVLLIAIYLF